MVATADTGTTADTSRQARGTAVQVAADPNAAPPAAKPWHSKQWKGRVVVGEYLTGTFCGGCQAHEQAFDALLHRYPGTAFIALAYHGTVNFPIADPVDSLWERMYAWYGPTANQAGVLPGRDGWDDWIDGHPTSTAAIDLNALMSQTTHELATEYYRTMARAADGELRKAPEAVLHIEATPNGGTLATTVTVDSLAPGHSDVYVRVLLVEDTVRLVVKPKRNAPGPRATHYMVVRLAARTDKYPLGLPLHGTGTVQYTFDVAKAQQRLLGYRTLGLSAVPGAAQWQADAQDEVKQIIGWFPDERSWRMDPTRLHVVAFVQDAITGDILQSQMTNVEQRGGAKLVLP